MAQKTKKTKARMGTHLKGILFELLACRHPNPTDIRDARDAVGASNLTGCQNIHRQRAPLPTGRAGWIVGIASSANKASHDVSIVGVYLGYADLSGSTRRP
jgi:hypothetical protein